MNYTWKTVYGDQRLVDLARQLRGEESSDSEESTYSAEDEVHDFDDVYSDHDDDSDEYEFVNEEEEEEDGDDNDEEEDDDDDDEEEDASSSEEEEVKESKFDKRWNDKYKQLKEYKVQNGHCNFPSKHQPNKSLATWVYKQRHEYRKMSKGLYSPMTQERVEKLENIGFSWVALPSKDAWNERFEELKKFQAQTGHCTVPRQSNKTLCAWVRRQRCDYNLSKSQMTEERIEKLENIGFVWTPTEDTWNERFEELKEFKAQHGHCNVPHEYDANKSLGVWVHYHRDQYKLLSKGLKSKITEERVEKLENIGFVWTPMKDAWNERFEELKKYKAQYGHCNVPYNDEANKALGGWVHYHRCQFQLMSKGLKSQITEERIKQLDSIGFVWTPTEDTWNERFEELKEFKAQHGHCNVPRGYDAHKSLGAWLATQRVQYKLLSNGSKSTMTQERVEKLENIGFVWAPMKDAWNDRFEELKKYKARYGHCNVPTRFQANKALGGWVHYHRSEFQLMSKGLKSKITEERIKQLDSIGFVWTPKKDAWYERFEDLKEFKARYGHCNVSRVYKPNKTLSRWVQKQRVQYKLMSKGVHSQMTKERVKTLESIGFEWSLKNKRFSRKNAIVNKKHSKKSIASKNPTVKRSSKKRIACKNATVERRSKRLRSRK